ncbi:hypothetical protein JTB14_011710 [Gonioctena quinquepunctata]|nr:hypothetical protein JTB14_011710 [Gonioctena quinquepunctata]
MDSTIRELGMKIREHPDIQSEMKDLVGIVRKYIEPTYDTRQEENMKVASRNFPMETTTPIPKQGCPCKCTCLASRLSSPVPGNTAKDKVTGSTTSTKIIKATYDGTPKGLWEKLNSIKLETSEDARVCVHHLRGLSKESLQKMEGTTAEPPTEESLGVQTHAQLIQMAKKAQEENTGRGPNSISRKQPAWWNETIAEHRRKCNRAI